MTEDPHLRRANLVANRLQPIIYHGGVTVLLIGIMGLAVQGSGLWWIAIGAAAPAVALSLR